MHSRTAAESPLAMRWSTEGFIDCLECLFESTAGADSILAPVPGPVPQDGEPRGVAGGPAQFRLAPEEGLRAPRFENGQAVFVQLFLEQRQQRVLRSRLAH